METGHIDRLTVIAIAVIAYAAANVTHEIIGHCGMALVMGNKCTTLSSFHIPLDTFPPAWKYNIIVAAGSTANFVLGIVCLTLLRKIEVRGQRSEIRTEGKPEESAVQSTARETLSRKTPMPGHTKRISGTRRLPVMLWLLMCVNLFLASSYVMSAPVIKFGDSYILIQNLPGQIFWRAAVALAGATALWFSIRAARNELARLIGIGGTRARAIGWQLVVSAYLAGGVLWVASALFSPLAWRIAQLEAAGGSFGLTIWLLVLPLFLPSLQNADREPLVMARSIAWIVAGALTALIFIGVWGRGIDV